MTYDVGNNKFPLDTTRKSFWKPAIAELLGYLRGYDNAAQFRKLGCKTWDANANLNADWLKNPNRKGEDDMGFVYGAVARNYPKPDGGKIDLLEDVVDKLSKGIDDRGLLLTFLHPGSFHLGCLRPCLHSHMFSILGNDLYLTSTQRSNDWALGGNFNSIQVFTLLKLMGQVTGLTPKLAYHKIVNSHIYEDQVDLMRDVQLKRKPFPMPELHINPDIKTLKDIETWVTTDDFEVKNYQHHAPIKYPFSV